MKVKGYTKIIDEPMWINMLSQNVDKERYHSVEEFEYDVDLMFSNCVLYNGHDSFYGLVRFIYFHMIVVVC